MDEEPAAVRVEPAIIVRAVSKQYGNDNKVLDHLDMTVLKGTIYGLLGASGCGKTTLLGAIVGSRKIQGGLISILGKAPGVIPVKSIGYMPQDIALVGEFSVKNVLQHQGWIFGMTDKEIEERHKFFEKLLDLPPSNKLVKNLSGGQQRRLSLAVVLVQDPELLVLDEPTVGLDPILRQNLWDYFTKITKEQKKTVVITTHYIEEAKQANTIGMLRNGKMLAEGEPQTLLNEYNCTSLENLFISLSSRQEEKHPHQQPKRLLSKFQELKILNQETPKKPLLSKLRFMNRNHAKALISKNFIRYVRHPGTLIITVFFPIVQICTVFTAVGRIPNDMKIGIVNQELGNYSNCENYIQDNPKIGGSIVDENGTCVYNGLACKFAEQFQAVIQNQIYFDSLEEGLKAIKDGRVHQVLFFPHNYSQAVTVVSEYFQNAAEEEFNFREVSVYRDDADFALGLYVEKKLHDFYFKFAESLAADCQRSKRLARLPLIFNEPVYGKPDLTFSDFIAPGIMALVSLALPKALAVHTIINERAAGVWERTIVSGITPFEILISHMLTMCCTSAIQVIESILTAYFVFNFECKGSMMYMGLMIYLQALVGVTIGMLLSVTSKTESEAIYGALGLSFPFFMLTGFFWPLEAMPPVLRYFSYILPPTIPIESLNNIIFRGWDIVNFHVYKGFLVSVTYIGFFGILSIFALKFEKK